jgi:acyl dehydratase
MNELYAAEEAEIIAQDERLAAARAATQAAQQALTAPRGHANACHLDARVARNAARHLNYRRRAAPSATQQPPLPEPGHPRHWA